MMPIYRRRRLSKRTRSRSISTSFRMPIDPRVLRLRYSSGGHPNSHQHANIIRPLLQLVERQNSSLAALPRIRQARSEMEKKLEEVTKRLEIFSELNDAYQALIDNLKGVQQDQSKQIDQLQKTIETLLQEQERSTRSSAGTPAPSTSAATTATATLVPCPTCTAASLPSTAEASADCPPTEAGELKVLDLMEADFGAADDDESAVVDLPQLETEIIYDFVV